MQVMLYWFARTALLFAVLILLWFVGWQHWTAVVGAAVIAWLVSYLMFGSLHDAAARQIERWLSGRFAFLREDDDAEDRAA